MKTLEMPSFGADMETGKVVEWYAKEGDFVKKGEIIAAIETAKGIIDMEVFDDCTVQSFIVPLDEEIEVGKPIVQLVSDGVNNSTSDNVRDRVRDDQVGDIADSETSFEFDTATKKETKVPDITVSKVILSVDASGVLATPAARALAAEKYIDLTNLTGTGAAGAVCLKDVESVSTLASKKSNPNNEPKESKKRRAGFDSDQMRLAIAAVVSKSKREIPHYYLSLDIDLTKSEVWLEKINTERTPEQRLMINVPIMCAVGKALHKHPDFNGFYQDDYFTPAPNVHLGLAIRLRNKGLVAPAIHDADKLNAFEMMDKLKSVVERSKLGGLKQSELQDATTTLSNIGDRGCDQIFGVIFPPQVAIIGVGKINQKAMAIEGSIEVRTVVNISLAADHRVTDGQMGARFLNEINKQLQKPEKFIGGPK